MQEHALHLLNQQRGLLPAAPASAPPLAPAAGDMILQQVLRAHAAHEAQYLRTERTWQGYQTAAAAFSAFLQRWVAPGNTWQTCTPLDVLVYIYCELLQKHRGRDGGLASPSHVEGLLSALSRVFEMRGRDQLWSHQLGSGNPLRSDLISNFKQCYARQHQTAGGCETSAVPLTWERYTALMDQFDLELQQMRHERRELKEGIATRDAAITACMWAHSRRGQDQQNVHWEGAFTEAGVPVVQHWAAGGGLCARLYLIPRQTKTERTGRVGTLVLQAAAEPKYCAIARLHQYYHYLAARGAVSGPMFCAMDGKGARALTTQALQDRFKLILRKSGSDRGETLHGMRRGRAQHDRDQGASEAALRQLTGIRTEATLQRYLDPGRHLRVPKDSGVAKTVKRRTDVPPR